MNFIEIESEYDYKGNKLSEKEKILINLDLVTHIEKNNDGIERGNMPSVFIEFVFVALANNIELYFPSLEERDKYYDNLVEIIHPLREQEIWIQKMKEEMEERNRQEELDKITKNLIIRKDIYEKYTNKNNKNSLQRLRFTDDASSSR